MALILRVMYSDKLQDGSFRTESAPVTSLESLAKTNVLALLVQDTAQNTRALRNVATAHGTDTYILCVRNVDGGPQVMLFGFDEGDFAWKRAGVQLAVSPPIGALHVEFTGVAVPMSDWEAAKLQAQGLLDT